MVVRRKPKTIDEFISGSPDSAKNSHASSRKQKQVSSEPGDDSSRVQRVDPEKLQPLSTQNGSGQPRKYFSPEGMAELEASIRHKGIQEPLLVRRTKNELQIVSGERRWRCALNLKLDTVPCIIRDLSDGEALEIALVANLIREDLNPVEETDNLIELISLRLQQSREDVPGLLTQLKNARQRQNLDDDKSRLITQVEEVLTAFSITLDTFVSNRLPLLSLPEVLLEAVRQGNIEFSKAQLIARLPEKDQEDTLKAAIAGSFTKAVLKDHIQQIRAGGKTALEEQTPSLRARVHSAYQKIRSKKVWQQLERNQRLRERLEKLEEEMQNILEETGNIKD